MTIMETKTFFIVEEDAFFTLTQGGMVQGDLTATSDKEKLAAIKAALVEHVRSTYPGWLRVP